MNAVVFGCPGNPRTMFILRKVSREGRDREERREEGGARTAWTARSRERTYWMSEGEEV